MYKKKPAPKKRTLVRGKKQKALKIKKIILIFLLICGVILLLLGVKKLTAVAFSLERPSWLEWRVKKITIDAPTPNTKYAVDKYVSIGEGDIVTSQDCRNLKNILAANLKQLKKVSVRRKFFSNELKIKVKKHLPQARIIIDLRQYYLAQNGVLFSDEDLKTDETLLKVYLKGKIKGEFLPQELVELIGGLAAQKNLGIASVYLDLDTNTYSVEVANKTIVQMGPWTNTKRKLKMLAEVLNIAREKQFKEPYTINLKNFEDGKIYLNSSK
jgi:cell division septal protein FtsQ